MSNFLSKLWPVLLAIYIISPFDAHPLFLDDLIAAGALFYMIYKNCKAQDSSLNNIIQIPVQAIIVRANLLILHLSLHWMRHTKYLA